jgi:hypothetical protein
VLGLQNCQTLSNYPAQLHEKTEAATNRLGAQERLGGGDGLTWRYIRRRRGALTSKALSEAVDDVVSLYTELFSWLSFSSTYVKVEDP